MNDTIQTKNNNTNVRNNVRFQIQRRNPGIRITAAAILVVHCLRAGIAMNGSVKHRLGTRMHEEKKKI